MSEFDDWIGRSQSVTDRLDPVRSNALSVALGGEGVLERVMRDGGFVDVRTKVLRARFVLPSAADALTLLQEAAGAYRAVVAELGETERARAWGEVSECLKGFEAGGGFQTELELVLGSGARPS